MSQRLFNPKCLAIAAGGVGLWYVYPTRNSSSHLLWALLLGSGIYVGISWYDYIYDCEDKNVLSSALGVLRSIKPTVGADGRYGSSPHFTQLDFGGPLPAVV